MRKQSWLPEFLKALVFLVPLGIGVYGTTLAGVTPLKEAVFQSLCYYTLANPEVPANIFQEIARWTAPLATVSWVYLGITRIWRKLNNFTTFRKGNSVAVYGDPEQTAVLLEQLGDRGIAGEDEFVEAQQYIFADTEKENFNRYQHMKQQIKDRKVCIRVDDVHGRESGKNMILYNDKATAAVKYWQKNLLYDDVCQTDFTGDVVILGFGNMEKELLINALQLNVFDQKQKITYHVFEDTGRNELLTSLKAELFQNGYLSGSKVSGEEFQKVYHEIDQIPDPVIFHKDPWYDNLDLLAGAARILIFDDVQLALKVMFAIPKVKIHLLSDRKEEIATIENSDRVVVFDWRREGQSVEDILLNTSIEEAKHRHILYVQNKDKKNAPADTPENREKEWRKMDTFTRYNSIVSYNYHEIRRQMMKREGISKKDFLNNEDVQWRYCELEHLRWERYYYTNNWRYKDVEKDPVNLYHNCLVPYITLDPSIRQRDFNSISKLMAKDK